MRTEHENESPDRPTDLIWTVPIMARVLNKTPKAVYHLIARGKLRSVKDVGGRKCASRRALLADVGVAE
jgi:hypothetical protein